MGFDLWRDCPNTPPPKRNGFSVKLAQPTMAPDDSWPAGVLTAEHEGNKVHELFLSRRLGVWDTGSP
jgi:hypothetical protein